MLLKLTVMLAPAATVIEFVLNATFCAARLIVTGFTVEVAVVVMVVVVVVVAAVVVVVVVAGATGAVAVGLTTNQTLAKPWPLVSPAALSPM